MKIFGARALLADEYSKLKAEEEKRTALEQRMRLADSVDEERRRFEVELKRLEGDLADEKRKRADAERRADDAALKVNEDAKQFAANLRSEILTRVHRESATLDALFDAKIPPKWLDKSWQSATIGAWFQGLLQRHAQLTRWLERGRPKSYWMTGFFNPQGFLTAMKQEVNRKHDKEKWALDDVVMDSWVTSPPLEESQLKDEAKEALEKQAPGIAPPDDEGGGSSGSDSSGSSPSSSQSGDES